MANLAAQRALTMESFRGWPCLALRQGSLVLRVVPQVGGRLMGIAFDDVELSFIHPHLQGRTFDGSAQAWSPLCEDWSFPLWGGGKTWIAPQADWPDDAPHRDLDSLAWTVLEAWCSDASMGVALQSPVCARSQLQLERRLTLTPAASQWTVEHVLRNCSAQAVRCGIWDVLMLCRPGEATVPLPGVRDACEPTVIALPGHPSVAALANAGVLVQAEHQARVACVQAGEFKLGFASVNGLVEVVFPQSGLRYERRSMVHADQPYAHGKPVEIFNAPVLPYFEVESHSPLVTLQPGESIHFVVHEQVWGRGALQPPAV